MGLETNLGEARISAKCAISREDFASRWKEEVAARVGRLRAVGRRWHLARARGLETPREERVSTCGRSRVVLRCGCDQLTAVPQRCQTRVVCEVCQRAHARRQASRVEQSVSAHLAEAVDRWARSGGRGPRPGVYLVTLTLPHGEGAEAALDRSWRAMRRYAGRMHWSASCATVLEWTPGRDDRGHPHLHVVVVAQWVDYRHVHQTWGDAVESTGWPRPGGRGVHVAVRRGSAAAAAAARYVAKYLSLSEVALTAVQWARLAAYYVGRRSVRVTKGWWRWAPRPCSTCEQRYLWLSPRDGWWVRCGGPTNRWDGARVRVEYDPLSGWCRLHWDADNPGLDETHDYGLVSMVDAAKISPTSIAVSRCCQGFYDE